MSRAGTWILRGMLLGALVGTSQLQAVTSPTEQEGLSAESGPKVLVRTQPEMPEWMFSERSDAVSVVKVLVDEEGRVSEILAIHSTGRGVDLNDWNWKVADAVRVWRFESGQAGDAQVRVRLGVVQGAGPGQRPERELR